MFKVHPSVGTVYTRAAEKFGFQSDAQSEIKMEAYFKEEWKRRSSTGQFDLGGTMREERAWWYHLVKAVFDRLGGLEQFDDFFNYLYRLFTTPEVWQLFPEVMDVLQACRDRGMILGIVSNWDSRLLEICQELDLTRRFDFILASAVVGVSKPDPEIFRMALQRAGVQAEEAFHVGDSIKDDIFGARAAGVDALLIDRLHDCHDHEVAVTDSLQAVIDFC